MLQFGGNLFREDVNKNLHKYRISPNNSETLSGAVYGIWMWLFLTNLSEGMLTEFIDTKFSAIRAVSGPFDKVSDWGSFLRRALGI